MITKNKIRNDIDLVIKLHRDMWTWLSLNPTKSKDEWPKWTYNGGNIEICSFHCFCCEYSVYHEEDYISYRDCSKCPIKWPSLLQGDSIKCTYIKSSTEKDEGRGLYNRWLDTINNDKRKSQLARAIANLPINEKSR